jgi:hypothetical protein
LAAVSPAAFASSDALDFDGSYSALNLGWDSGWWPGGGTGAPGGSPLQVRVSAIAAADANAEVHGGLQLEQEALALTPGSGAWNYQFGAALAIQAAINLSFTVPNPFGSDFKLGPWIVDVPFTPGFDLLTNGETSFNGYLLDDSSTLADVTEDIPIYNLSLIEYLIGGIDLPDWVLDVLDLDAGLTLNASIETTATLSCDSILLSDGTVITTENGAYAVSAAPPSFDVAADYNERLDWDLTLIARPSLFIRILGQRWDLPILAIPWNVFDGVQDLNMNTDYVSLAVEPTPEGEGEGVFEGEPEGTVEGAVEGELEGSLEGEDTIEFTTGCPAPCETGCASDSVVSGFETALLNLYSSELVAVNPFTADLDGDAVRDIDLAKLLDVVLASFDMPTHCCVRVAYQQNYGAVATAVAAGNPPSGTLSDTMLIQALTGLVTLGTPESYGLFRSIADSLALQIPSESLSTAAAPVIAAFGDADLDGVCNVSEYYGAQQNALGFIFAATDPQLRTSGAVCALECFEWTEGEATEGEGEFTANVNLLMIQEGDGQGVVLVSPDQASFAPGTALVLQVVVAPGSAFGGWNGVSGVAQPGENGDDVVWINGTNQYILLMDTTKVIRPYFYSLGLPEGEGEAAEGEGEPAEGEGEVAPPDPNSADMNGDFEIQLEELLRMIQMFNAGAYYCDAASDDGFSVVELVPGASRLCAFHSADYNPANWTIELSELLRVVQFFNLGGYVACDESEDGYCAASR